MSRDTSGPVAPGAGAPKPLGDPVTHLWLARSMARAAGIDLGARQAAGELRQQDWADMIQRCRGCDFARAGGCRDWLRGRTAGAAAAAVPAACANAATFHGLGAATGPARDDRAR